MSAGSPRAPRTRLSARDHFFALSSYFQRILHCFFTTAGHAVGSHPFTSLLLFVLMLCTSFGLLQLRCSAHFQYGFVPTKAPSIQEMRVHTDFFGRSSKDMQSLVVAVRRKDRNNLLNREDLKSLLELERFISTSFRVRMKNFTYVHKDHCRDRCDSNEMFRLFTKVFENAEAEHVLLDYPKTHVGSASFLVAHHLHGVRLKDSEPPPLINDDLLSAEVYNLTFNGNKSRIYWVEMVNFFFEAPLPSAEALHAATLWETKLLEWSLKGDEFPQYDISIMGDKVLGQEMMRGGMSLAPHMCAGFSLTVLFVAFSVIRMTGATMGDAFPVALLIIGVLLPPIGAILFALGLIGLFSIEIYPILIVLPFLVVAIGVDDAFLLLHSWCKHLSLVEKVAYGTRDEITAKLMAEVLADVGPSMLLTSLTNSLAFAVGAAFATPAMQVFSVVASIAMVVDFIFEILCFCSLVVISGRHMSHSTAQDYCGQSTSRLIYKYSRFITKRSTQICVIGITFIYFAASFYGMITISIQINSTRIIPTDSPLRSTDKLLQQYVWKEYEPVQVFVNAPPNFTDSHQMKRFRTFIEQLETLPRAVGSSATMIWIDDYEKMVEAMQSFYSYLGVDYDMGYDLLPDFANGVGKQWNSTIKWHIEDKEVVVDSFVFFIGFHNSSTWMQRAENMINWRRIADNWLEFNATIFSENSAVYDGIFAMTSTTYQTAAITLTSMIFICFLFVPSCMGVCAAAFAICSISTGVFGALSWMQFDLDPITMVAIIMSIGFSVDYTAHVCYHYHKAHMTLPSRSQPRDVVYTAISSVGFPMLQAAASTILCFLPAAIHPDYTPKVFVTSVVSVVCLGTLHGFIVLPTILSLIPRKFFKTGHSRQPSRSTVPQLEENGALTDNGVCTEESAQSATLEPLMGK